MEAEFAALASVGAATLVSLMVSESWTQVKQGFAELFSRGGATDGALRHLEMSQAELMAARMKGDDAEAIAVEAEWRCRLSQLLRSDPTAGAELRHLLHPPGTGSVGPVYNINSGDVRFGSVIQAGQISGAAFHVIPTPCDTHQRENEE
jgi:hypothetical protein